MKFKIREVKQKNNTMIRQYYAQSKKDIFIIGYEPIKMSKMGKYPITIVYLKSLFVYWLSYCKFVVRGVYNDKL